jgi:hypothetical protein
MGLKQVISRLGGQNALSKHLGIRQSAIAYWVKKGMVPAKWHTPLLDYAFTRGLPLTAAELVVGHNLSPTPKPKTPFSAIRRPLVSSQPPAQAPSTAPALAEDKGTLPASIGVAETPFLFYAAEDGSVKVQVVVRDESIWASQKGMAEIFDTSRENITIHLKNIFDSKELEVSTVCKDFLHTAADGKVYKIVLYNLDAIISVGYRVNSYKATQFRRWATSILKTYLIKGYALDDERLKQGKQLFGKDYFDELLEKIREIRASERRFYQKITDIYAQCSIDYDAKSPITERFYQHVQDKLHYAIHGHTSAELIAKRADAQLPYMGLTSWKAQPRGGKITKQDVTVGKNYLQAEEIEELNRVVSMYLDFAENQARRQRAMTMQDWATKLDDFLRFNGYPVLENHGSVQRTTAEKQAFQQYEKFRVVQDKEYKSDFDKVLEAVQARKKLSDL